MAPPEKVVRGTGRAWPDLHRSKPSRSSTSADILLSATQNILITSNWSRKRGNRIFPVVISSKRIIPVHLNEKLSALRAHRKRQAIPIAVATRLHREDSPQTPPDSFQPMPVRLPPTARHDPHPLELLANQKQ